MANNSSNHNTVEALVDKLHGVMAPLRLERDVLHRKKALAEKRLRLFKEEMEALEKTVAAAQSKLETIQERVNTDALKEMREMEEEVARLNKEVRSLFEPMTEMRVRFGVLIRSSTTP